ncbi:MAG: 3-phosphoshikimate 1-carboxyvinyltransferase [Pirellulales bacterium]|nr:3-phosphoshikimate 1-carboxyvinyltransferase [Pirellulales bacterium]
MTRTETVRTSGPIDARIRPPGSKSITNRALVCAALADGSSTLRGALDSEDTQVMIAALGQLGIKITPGPLPRSFSVEGAGGQIPATEAHLHVGNSGTTMRFLAAMLSVGKGHYEIDGVSRMRERPVGDLLEALVQLGAKATSLTGNLCPPVCIEADGLPGGTATVRGDISSQFLSGLLMAAPYARAPVELRVPGPLVSQPYVQMTLDVMREFGVEVNVSSTNGATYSVPTGTYRARDYSIEPDASAASYFFAAAAITGGRMTVEGLSRKSLQGDVAFVDELARMGCQIESADDSITVVGRPLRGITTRMTDISDTVQTLAAVACFADGPTTITGVGHIRHKETDRIGDLARELRKLGAQVDEFPDGLHIVPGRLQGATIETYRDHRMAMSLALVGLRVPGVQILDPDCTAKTYPEFFADLARVTAATVN